MERVDCVVIGAGVVGLACARALAMAGREVVIAERAGAFGTETSARNSEVIHAGIYYARGSLKARLCRPGRDALYAFCAEHDVAHRRSGKLVVATDPTQHAALDAIEATARAAGVNSLRRIGAEAARGEEPRVTCTDALLSPDTGLVDSHGLMLALLGEAEAHGAMLALGSPVEGGEAGEDGIALRIGGVEPMRLTARTVVNAAGLWSQRVSHSIAGIPRDSIPEAHFARGVWFALPGRQPFSRPVYPVPEPGGLGCHYTIDLGGQGKFGPDVEWIDGVDYTLDPARAGAFYAAIRRYWPDLPDGALQPAYTGVRPKTAGPGGPATDFVIQGPESHGLPGWIALYGIESPGLTSALAIAGEVAARA